LDPLLEDTILTLILLVGLSGELSRYSILFVKSDGKELSKNYRILLTQIRLNG